MNTFVKHILGILFIALAINGHAQDQHVVLEVNPGNRVIGAGMINTSPVLVPLDSLVERPLPVKASKIIRICGSCGHHSNGPVSLYISIGRKQIPIPLESTGMIKADWIETLAVAKGKRARKYGYLAKTNGTVVITLKKAFEQQFLAGLPEDYVKYHKM